MLGAATAQAADCGADAIGTSRRLVIDGRTTEGLGKFNFATPPLARNEVILTFDDGPSPKTTPLILDYLKSQCISATFFLIGQRAESYPDLVRREAADGHTVGSHSYSHKNLAETTLDEARIEITRGAEAVEAALTDHPAPAGTWRMFRFPENKMMPETIALAREAGFTVISADITPADWRNDPPEVTLERLKRQLDTQGNGIIVLHDNRTNTVKLLPLMIAEFKARGIKIVQLDIK